MMQSTPHRRFLARLLAVVGALALIAAACSDDADGEQGTDSTTSAPGETTTTTTQPATTAPIPETGEALEDLQLSVVQFGADGFVEIVNTGSDAVTLAGVFICEFPDYADLGDVVDVATLESGETARIAAEHLGGITADGGEAALYAGNDFGSADAILSYVQWGSGDHERSSVAADAGLWPAVDVFVTPDPEFGSIESGGFAADPESWS